ncbi:MAG TPA: hypothetical protein VIJ15_09705, partial [Dermatophilaceae bacterium]
DACLGPVSLRELVMIAFGPRQVAADKFSAAGASDPARRLGAIRPCACPGRKATSTFFRRPLYTFLDFARGWRLPVRCV